MKLKKSILFITILFLITLVVGSFGKVQAATGSLNLNIKMIRNSGFGYQLGNTRKNVWKIYEVGGNADDTIYCLKGGPGFGSGDFMQANPQNTLYTQYFNLKDPNSIPTTYQTALPTINSSNYRALIWVLDNCYVAPKQNASAEAKEEAAENRKILLDAATRYAVEQGNPDISDDGFEFESLTDDDIDAVQQLAIWYFTNPTGDYHVNKFEFYINAVKNVSSSYIPLSDFEESQGSEYKFDRSNACQALFDYLVKNADTSYNYTSSSIDIARPVEFANTQIQTKTSGNRIIVGPYHINKVKDIKYSLEKEIKDGNGNVISNVILLDENENQVESTVTLIDIINSNKDFYISLPSGTNTSKIEFNIKGNTYTTVPTYWSVESPGSTDQPVVKIEKVKIPFNDIKIYTEQIEGSYDLELVKIDGQNESTKLQGAEYEITLADGTKRNYTTDNEGKISFSNIQITEVGTQTITIKEIKAPTGYSKNNDPITLTITTAKQGTNYIVSSVVIGGRTLTSNLQDIEAGKTKLKANISGNKILVQMKDYKLDLALRKFITQIDGKAPEKTRQPQIDAKEIEALANGVKIGSKTTVTKVHPKNPLTVKEGSTVLYTIRIYNEGLIPAYAKEITDYLPEGLKLKENSQINADNGWTNPSGDGRTIKTAKLAGELLAAFDGTKIDSRDIQVECTVVATNNTVSLKNIAEITKHSDENNDETVKDVDSIPDNVKLPDYTDSQEDDDDFEDLILYEKGFDLALRKFITSIDGKPPKEEEGGDRTPNISNAEIERLKNEQTTTVEKIHPKNPLKVKTGDKVIYKIRIYNEGEKSGFATEVTDYLPSGLKMVQNSEINTKYGWKMVKADGTITTNPDEATYVKTDYLKNKLIKGFDGTNLSHEDLEIECEVVAGIKETSQNLKNIAEITQDADEDGNPVKDRDSEPNNVRLPDYTDSQEDDDDYEHLILEGKYFDLSLRKFITKIQDGENVKEYDRAPKVDTTYLANGTTTTAIYNHPKDPIGVSNGNIVTYTIRVYNEGEIDGYVDEITDYLPPQLEFIVDDSLNAKYGWTVSANGRVVKTTITSPKSEASATRDEIYKERSENADKVLLKAFNKESKELDYIDVQIRCKVKEKISLYQKITNIAEISKFTDSEGNEIKDRDSNVIENDGKVVLPSDEDLPNYNDTAIEKGDKYIPGQQDDDDFEKLVLQRFDLALRKFITGVNEQKITNREPVFKKVNDTEYKYEHTKEPVEVANGNTVIYTLRIFNEGNVSGYAKEIKDNLPDGLEYLPEHELNKQYCWKMIDKDGKETNKLEEAVSIRTDYLSKEQEKTPGANLIKAYDPSTMKSPAYKDVQIAFKVTEPNTSDRIIINTAEISDDSDENGKPVEDIDSVPDNDKPEEDDIDIEKIKVKYFDLSLKKWVTEAIVTYNGKTTVNKTGHTGDENPEPPAKVELRGSRMNKTTVKFKFNIKVTNEGEIAGYAKELIDYIPQGLKFVQADNPKWKEVDGKVVTDQLKDKLLQPGESATVEIILTWINGKENLGEKENWAEISKDDNEYDSPDIDSTPGNNKKGEDDIDRAPVILSVVTGNGASYITLGLVSVSILAGGIFLIKKFVI